MKRPSVTVCIATCNQRALIAQCILSVIEQDVDAELQLLIGDDASDDGTSEIIADIAREHPTTVTHLRRKPRMGAFANMRDLILRAEGEFIARVDGDDYWLPGKLQQQLDCMHRHPDCSAVYTNALTVNESGCRLGIFNDAGDMRIDLAYLLRTGNFLNNSSVLFRQAGKCAWMEADIQIDYRAHLWHARHGHLRHIGEPLTAYRVNTSGSLMNDQHERIRELYWQAIQSVPRSRVEDMDYALGLTNFMRRILLRSLRTGQFRLAWLWARRILRASPFGRFRTLALLFNSVIVALTKHLKIPVIGALRRQRVAVLHRR